MSRKTKITESEIKEAIAQAMQAETVEELRQAQAIILPGIYRMTVDATGQILGRSPATVSRLQGEFRKRMLDRAPRKDHWGGRRRAYLSDEQEKEFLKEFIEEASEGGIIEIGCIIKAFEERVGHTVAKTTVYRMLERHDWRKIVPRKKHPLTNMVAQEKFKKNSLK